MVVSLKRSRWLRILFIVLILNCQSGLSGEFTGALVLHLLGKIFTNYMQYSEGVSLNIELYFYLAPLYYYYYGMPDLSSIKARLFPTKKRELYEDLKSCTLILDNNNYRFWFAIRGCENSKADPCAEGDVKKVIDELKKKAESYSPKLLFTDKEIQDLMDKLQPHPDRSRLIVGDKSEGKLEMGLFKITPKKDNPRNCKSFSGFDETFKGVKLSDILDEGDLTAADYEPGE